LETEAAFSGIFPETAGYESAEKTRGKDFLPPQPIQV
jgi:hypothetical protein